MSFFLAIDENLVSGHERIWKSETLMNRLLPSVLGVALTIAGCLNSPPRYEGETSRKRCTFISRSIYGSDTSLQDCIALANSGDGDAAWTLGEYYRSFGTTNQANHWYGKAADLGNVKAMRKVFDAYYFGFNAPKNTARADEYLLKAGERGAEWAQLVLARRIEKTEPSKAMELYLNVARNDNCHAQARLAQAYFQGDITERNPTQAYFWVLLARVGVLRHSEYHSLASPTDKRMSYSGNETLCLQHIGLDYRIESALPQEFARIAQDAATSWRKGHQEAMLPLPTGPDLAISSPKSDRQGEPSDHLIRPETPRTVDPPKTPAPLRKEPEPTTRVASLPKWAPLRFNAQPSAGNTPKGISELFKLISRSVWVVVAAPTQSALKRGSDIAQGSAVAITKNQLFTNCHIIEGRPLVWIKQADKVTAANIMAGDSGTDRCILSVEQDSLDPVQGFRKYETLLVGEEVYTIGSPSGLESTLGPGIISGLRRLDSQRLIQTTAPISPGSSGGGLFDRSGNVIGITTFIVGKGQSLNFAIAVDDFFR